MPVSLTIRIKKLNKKTITLVVVYTKHILLDDIYFTCRTKGGRIRRVRIERAVYFSATDIDALMLVDAVLRYAVVLPHFAVP